MHELQVKPNIQYERGKHMGTGHLLGTSHFFSNAFLYVKLYRYEQWVHTFVPFSLISQVPVERPQKPHGSACPPFRESGMVSPLVM